MTKKLLHIYILLDHTGEETRVVGCFTNWHAALQRASRMYLGVRDFSIIKKSVLGSQVVTGLGPNKEIVVIHNG